MWTNEYKRRLLQETRVSYNYAKQADAGLPPLARFWLGPKPDHPDDCWHPEVHNSLIRGNDDQLVHACGCEVKAGQLICTTLVFENFQHADL